MSHDIISTAQNRPTSDTSEFLIVGIGASAGGLSALEEFFRSVSADTPAAFVVVQHLSPDHKSLMDELLKRCTTIPLCYATDGLRVESNHVYLLPPGKEIILSGGLLLLTDKPRGGVLSLPIDHFFRSLAGDAGPRAVGIVLSGTGSDGSRGLQQIHTAGGLVISQSLPTSKFDGMPRAAYNTGIVDLVLAPAQMPDAIQRYAENSRYRKDADTDIPPLSAETAMKSIFRLLKSTYGMDFSQYKAATICRRIDRRLLMKPELDLDAYVNRLEVEPEELDRLYQDLLIGVTRFFRDSDAYEKVEHELLPELVKQCPPDEEFRAWVAGCATGEEAYSLAIILMELFEQLHRPLNFKIFATDVHENSLKFAGRGIYPDQAVAEMSPERLGRFFKRTPDGFRVSQHLRKNIVFAPHNLIADPPFTNMNLVTCRNLLIYLRPPAQKKVLSLFHFSLRVGGGLWLGPSETLGELSEEFDALDEHWRIFFKARDVRLLTSVSGPMASSESAHAAAHARSRSPNFSSHLLEIYDRLLNDYIPAGFLIDQNRRLIHTFGGAGKYLIHRDGRSSLDVLDLLDPEIKVAMATALQRAKRERGPVVCAGITCPSHDGGGALKLTVKPFFNSTENSTDLLVLLEPTELPRHRRDETEFDATTMSAEQLHALEAELTYTKETLQATIEQLESTNEELQASNEEMLASNEELQSTNEELHSVNEELYTVNAEHQRKITELTELSDDVENLLNNTDLQILFLDRDLKIRKFTPAVARSFSLIPQDVGRPVDHISHSIQLDDLHQRIERVLTTEETFEHYVQDRRGNWHWLRILPYMSRARIEGVVLTLVDVSDLKQAEARLAELSAIVEQSEEAIIRRDLDGTISTWNLAAERLFGFSAEEMIGKNIDVLEPAARHGESDFLRARVNQGQAVEHFETTRLRHDGSEIDISLSISPLRGTDGHVVGASLFAHDITERRHAEAQIRDAIRRRDQFLAMLSHELRNPLAAVLNASHVLERLNKSQDNVELLEACDVIVRQGQQMARLLDDLLDVSRVTQGKIELRRQVFDFRSLINDAVEVVHPQIVERQIQLHESTVDTELPVNADRSRLLQVVENLLKNAVKYSPPGEQIWITLEGERDNAMLKVRDSGIGIPADQLQSIFDLFVQSEDSLDRAEGGMGVGLTLVKAVVELHGGTVEAFSEGRGHGSEFVVRLPIYTGESVSQVEPVEPPSTQVSRVVVVEDQPDNRRMMETLLRMEGCEVFSAADGQTGLDLIQETHPQLALIDLGLPGIDGYEVARRLRNDPANDEIFLIALTGYGRPQDRENVLNAGFNEHIVKPLAPDELYRKLRVKHVSK